MKGLSRTLAIAALLAIGLFAFGIARGAGDGVESLAAAERAFAAYSVEHGMKDAFLAFLADDGVLFTPTVTNGKARWNARPASKATLVWEPEYAEVSYAGDLGWTCGPWEFHPPAGAPDTTVFHGHFNTVWAKQPDGSWKVAADIGGDHARPQHGVGSGRFRAVPAHAAPHEKPSKRAPDLGALCDRAFGARTRTVSIGQTFQAFAAQDVRLQINGAPPKIGRLEAYAALDTMPGTWAFDPAGSRVSASRDLGATWGTVRRFAGRSKVAADTTVYLNVWRRDGPRWELSLMVLNPLR